MTTASTPLVDHIADKIAATFDRYGKSRSSSTRYKDLIDLVAIGARRARPWRLVPDQLRLEL